MRQTRGEACTEDLRQAMIHYRTLFEELITEPEMARAKLIPPLLEKWQKLLGIQAAEFRVKRIAIRKLVAFG